MNEFIGRIDYLDNKGNAIESVEYKSEEIFKKELEYDTFYGIPIAVIIYTDINKSCISLDFIKDLDPPPKDFNVILNPHLVDSESPVLYF